MKLNTFNHPKFLRLKRLLDRPACTCAGVLELIWAMASMFASDGDLSRFTAQEIADFCEFDGDAEVLLRSLIESRWLDSVDGAVRVHDWLDHCPDYISDRMRKRAERSRPVQDCPDLSGAVQTCPDLSENVRLSQAKPSQAQPSQVKPNQQQASLPAADWLSFSKEEQAEICRNAGKLAKAYKQLETEFCWRVAWVGFAVERGFVGDLVNRAVSKSVRSPKGYITRALQAELEKVGRTIEECFSFVPDWHEWKQFSGNS
jgi:hypothetical protein